MKRLLALLTFLALPAWAQDFASDPRAFCDYLAKAGQTAQFKWGETKPGSGYYMCQHAEHFGGNATHVRAGRALVDTNEKNVSLALSVMGLGGMLRLEARDVLMRFVGDFFRAQGRAVPPRVHEILATEQAGEQEVGAERVHYSADMWKTASTVGITFTTKATPALLTKVKAGPTQDESAAAVDLQARLDQRCVKAIESSGQPSQPARWKRQAVQAGAFGYVFTYEQPDGRFSCQVCDEDAPGSNCPTLGLTLTHATAGAEHRKLPAEVDRKCVSSLQWRLKSRDDKRFIDHEMVRRVVVTPMHTDIRWAYAMSLDGDEFRCVVRKQDLSYVVERRSGAGWQSVAGGVLQ